GVKIHREGDNLRLEIPSQLTFEINRSDIRPQLYPVLNDIARVLANYDKTMLIISGHTDDTGPYDFNMRLSLQRADSVSSYLAAQGVLPIRMETQGFGPTYPMVPNTSEANRALNRRVEIHIEPVTES
ncbi:MAG: OmpA family protein, partial [Alkalimonas sp.]|nr:OmpA family protein [Alkalimonas sp.]